MSGSPALTPRPPVALYVHFPFCLSICPYCDFVVYAGRQARGSAGRIEGLVSALEAEIGLRSAAARAAFGQLPPLGSLYFGGGTPSLLLPAQLARLIEAVAAGFGLAADAELTLEVNPGSADRGDLAGFRSAGINRLSIGAQSFEPAELRALGRRHEPHDVVDTVVQARTAGFDNLGLDLLYDVPGQTVASWRRTLSAALALEPQHVSAYALALDDPDAEGLTSVIGDHLPLRPGARRWRERVRNAQDADIAADCYELADELLGAAGLQWYELSNWAAASRASRHNLAYWTGEAWEAVGPGAHAFDGGRTRSWNAARLDAYLAALADGRLPPGHSLTADSESAAAELAILHLRTATGLAQLPRDLPAFEATLEWGRRNGMLEPTAHPGVRFTLTGRLLANELFVRLLPDRRSAAA